MATETITIEQLRKLIAEAANKGDDAAMLQLMKQLSSRKADIAKAENEKLIKEAEALAGKRETLEGAINKMVKDLKLDKALSDVKSKGFTFIIDHQETINNETMPVKGATKLIVPQAKAVKVGHGGGSGKSKAEFGLSLQEIFDKFATAEDKRKLAAATSNSSQWQVKQAVKKAAIAAGLLKPVK